LLTSDAGAPDVRPHVVTAQLPPPPRVKGIPLDTVRDVAGTLDLERCFTALPGTDQLDFHARVMVTPDGKPHLVEMTGVEEGEPQICVKGRFLGLPFPTTAATTWITFDVRGTPGNFDVTARIDSVTDGAQQIDPADLQRP
jgi:hypothetical protein